MVILLHQNIHDSLEVRVAKGFMPVYCVGWHCDVFRVYLATVSGAFLPSMQSQIPSDDCGCKTTQTWIMSEPQLIIRCWWCLAVICHPGSACLCCCSPGMHGTLSAHGCFFQMLILVLQRLFMYIASIPRWASCAFLQWYLVFLRLRYFLGVFCFTYA